MHNPPAPGSAVIETCEGQYLDLANPDPEVITLQAIAHHLSQVCRYAGAPLRPYSVAEHTLLVAAYLERRRCPPNIVLGGLHHDDPEAFIGDVTRPMKELIAPLFKPVEDRMMAAVAKAFDFEGLGVDTLDPMVKEADNWALSAEAFHIMISAGKGWWCEGIFNPRDVNHFSVAMAITNNANNSLSMIASKWLSTHARLVRQIQSERLTKVGGPDG